MFVFNLQFHSPRAYEYFRRKFGNTLPHPSTIRKWFSKCSENCTGGFHPSAMKTLSEAAKELRSAGKTMFAALSFDEVAIRQHVQYVHCKKKFNGFINFGTLDDVNKPLPVAKNAMVIMLNAINIKLTLPIAFFFITTLIAEEKAIMVATGLKALTSIGVRVVSITSDGLSSNPAAYEILGASADGTTTFRPYFLNPENDQKVFVFYDTPHMLKLVRSCLGDKKVLYAGNKPIKWDYIERLYRCSKSGNIAHKLTKKHIEYAANAMNVSLATQTISNSVAECIEKCAAMGQRQFQGICRQNFV